MTNTTKTAATKKSTKPAAKIAAPKPPKPTGVFAEVGSVISPQLYAQYFDTSIAVARKHLAKAEENGIVERIGDTDEYKALKTLGSKVRESAATTAVSTKDFTGKPKAEKTPRVPKEKAPKPEQPAGWLTANEVATFMGVSLSRVSELSRDRMERLHGIKELPAKLRTQTIEGLRGQLYNVEDAQAYIDEQNERRNATAARQADAATAKQNRAAAKAEVAPPKPVMTKIVKPVAKPKAVAKPAPKAKKPVK
jgi:hypothetical protein